MRYRLHLGGRGDSDVRFLDMFLSVECRCTSGLRYLFGVWARYARAYGLGLFDSMLQFYVVIWCGSVRAGCANTYCLNLVARLLPRDMYSSNAHAPEHTDAT